MSPLEKVRFAIIGSGFSGICMGIKLLQAGYQNFTIYEKSESIGGTWAENTYPDCGCDVPSPLYSYSFELYPEWDRMWAKQSQILQYMKHVVSKYQLSPHLQLNTMMKSSYWDEKENQWKINLTSNGNESTVSADYLILAVGALHIPQFPSITGVSKIDGSSPFLGESFHAAKWNHSVSLQNKRVGVIGCGASAIQLIPEIAKEVKDLYVFQRTPPHVFPKSDFEVPSILKSLYRLFPFLMTLTRWLVFLSSEIRFSGLYEGSFFHNWMRVDSLRYLKSVVKSPELRKKIIPNYAIGCKRMLFSSAWYPALIRENVHVVNERIVNVNQTGIMIQKEISEEVCGEEAVLKQQSTENISLDVIVYATGFQLTRENATKEYFFEVIGRNGASLNEWHQQNPRTLLGMAAPSFPNLFHLYGPNTNLGHNSIIFMIECQTNYITNLITQSIKHNYSAIEVKEEAVNNFQETVIKKGLVGKVWNRCSSWYRWPVKSINADGTISITNTGEVYSMWPHTVVWYYWKTRWPSLADYHGKVGR